MIHQPMGWAAALGIAMVVLGFIGIVVAAIKRWHESHFIRIPYSELNAYRITPRFVVGSDAK